MFQDYALFPHLTVRQNIAFARRSGWRNPPRDIEDAQVVIHKKRVFGLPKLTFVDVRDIQGALVETMVDRDNDDNKPTESYRVALALAGEARVPLTASYHLSNMDEARRLAGRIEEMLRDARTE